MSGLTPTGAALVGLMNQLPRGPRRDGVFALWLTVRVAEDLALIPAIPERATRRRVAALEQRLSSLVLPGPLRRALAAALAELGKDTTGVAEAARAGGGDRAAMVLQQLVAPVREVLGVEAGDAMVRAVRGIKQDGGLRIGN